LCGKETVLKDCKINVLKYHDGNDFNEG